jgi:hypothetical protein
MQEWENTSGGNFEFSSEILSAEILGFQSRDFHVYDFDKDGDLDIFLQPFGSIEFPINFSSSIYVNNNGVFERYNEDIIFDDDYVNMYGLMFMVREDKPCYIGIEEMPAGQLKFYEFELTLD